MVSPASLAFGEINVGSTSTAQSITVTNAGGDILTIGTVNISGTNSTMFTKQADTCAGNSLQPADTCQIAIVFQPSTPYEAKSASLDINSNASDYPVLSAGLSGTASQYHYTLTVTKTGTGSGNVAVNAGSLSWLGNIGTANYVINTPVDVSASALAGSSFAGWTGDCAGNGTPCSLIMTSAKSVSATFNSKTDFSASPTSGNAPLFVSFTDLSTHNPTAWEWHFGDNTSSTEQNPTHIYAANGSYTVSLNAIGTGGAVTLIKNNYIIVSSCATQPVKIGGTPYYYSSIQNAYNVTGNHQSVQMQGVGIAGDVNLQNDTIIEIKGGYGCDYSTNPGFTIMQGTLSISDGTVTIENVIIK
jgi:PKD repeat protein